MSSYKYQCNKALTLLEVLVSLAIIAAVLASLLPQFRNIQNQWDSKKGNSETLQSGRVLIDHINRHLSSAVTITSISSAETTAGFIEYENSDGNIRKYMLNESGQVMFGPLDDLSELAGGVTELKFTGYALEDMDTPITDVHNIRVLEIDYRLEDAVGNSADKTFSTNVFMSVNGNDLPKIIKESDLEFEPIDCQTPDICKMSEMRFLCVYSGVDDRGFAVVLSVDKTNWTISKGTVFEFDSYCLTPVLSQIDTSHYLCVYTGLNDHGMSVVLQVDMGDYSVSKYTNSTFEGGNCFDPDLIRIDPEYFLCAYTGDDGDGWSTLLYVNDSSWNVTTESTCEFDPLCAYDCSLSVFNHADPWEILCVYTWSDGRGWPAVLHVNKTNHNITRTTSGVFESTYCANPSLEWVDTGVVMCAYEGPGSDGWVAILNVDTLHYGVTRGNDLEFDTTLGKMPVLVYDEEDQLFCTYISEPTDGTAVMLQLDLDNWTVQKGSILVFHEPDFSLSAVDRLDSTHYICVYQGAGQDGWATVFSIDDTIRP